MARTADPRALDSDQPANDRTCLCSACHSATLDSGPGSQVLAVQTDPVDSRQMLKQPWLDLGVVATGRAQKHGTSHGCVNDGAHSASEGVYVTPASAADQADPVDTDEPGDVSHDGPVRSLT